MADKVFIGGLCPKFIICSDWSVNGKSIVNCGNGRGCVASFFSDGVARRGWGACPRRGGRGWDVWIKS